MNYMDNILKIQSEIKVIKANEVGVSKLDFITESGDTKYSIQGKTILFAGLGLLLSIAAGYFSIWWVTIGLSLIVLLVAGAYDTAIQDKQMANDIDYLSNNIDTTSYDKVVNNGLNKIKELESRRENLVTEYITTLDEKSIDLTGVKFSAVGFFPKDIVNTEFIYFSDLKIISLDEYQSNTEIPKLLDKNKIFIDNTGKNEAKLTYLTDGNIVVNPTLHI